MGDEGPVTGNGCANHPKRLPVGRCPLCERLVCAECHVRLDGILHCRDCLAARERQLVQRGPNVAGRIAATIVALVLLFPALLGLGGFLTAVGTVSGRLSRRYAPAFDAALDPAAPQSGDPR
jgi:hypothetical protein